MYLTVLAIFSGSFGSIQPFGLPVSTAQKRQALVQIFPRTIKVAVRLFQHSPILGHFDSSQTVLR